MTPLRSWRLVSWGAVVPRCLHEPVQQNGPRLGRDVGKPAVGATDEDMPESAERPPGDGTPQLPEALQHLDALHAWNAVVVRTEQPEARNHQPGQQRARVDAAWLQRIENGLGKHAARARRPFIVASQTAPGALLMSAHRRGGYHRHVSDAGGLQRGLGCNPPRLAEAEQPYATGVDVTATEEVPHAGRDIGRQECQIFLRRVVISLKIAPRGAYSSLVREQNPESAPGKSIRPEVVERALEGCGAVHDHHRGMGARCPG